ncbi:hypothetical protein [Sphingobacterium detergens]|uniref:Uncharacterized protein n=1 Tax=Sphingobacterium detergens TaxID=1145106 RepID=A0A420B7W9_SPHD1|nr:hypothetical protein [Sphingobacterium detergens]RKE52738.1 hypothetical protein DFQ12_2983 [Sphingobacterium detergens]
MIYLSAQPDEQYFIWQLKIFLQSLITNQNVSRDQIHILLGYDPIEGVSEDTLYFIEEYGDIASIYVYKDERPNNIYLSTLRPHIIKKHFQQFDYLKDESIFYHDSDIAFTQKIDFSQFLNDEIWYISDAGSYLNADYIISKGGNDLLSEMAEIIGIDPQIVYDNNENTGGAQYIIKRTDAGFWDKVERDSESLYDFLNKFASNSQLENPIQSWCADMWAILWNAYYFNFPTKISSQLDFCWPLEKDDTWNTKSIYHDAGATLEKDSQGFNVFVKHYFHNSSPFYIDFDKDIHPETNSYKYVQFFKKIKNSHELKDSCFCIAINSDNELELTDLLELIRLINKVFNTYIFILSYGKKKLLQFDCENVVLKRIESVNENISYLNNQLFIEFQDEFKACGIKYLIFIRPHHRFLADQILSSILRHRSNRYQFTIPHNGELFIVPDEIVPYKIYKERHPYYTLNTKADYDFFIVNKEVFSSELECLYIIGKNTNSKVRFELYKRYSRNIINEPLIITQKVEFSKTEEQSNMKSYIANL